MEHKRPCMFKRQVYKEVILNLNHSYPDVDPDGDGSADRFRYSAHGYVDGR